MPPPGYTWTETPRLNRAIQARHRRRRFEGIDADFEAGYQRLFALAQSLPERALLEPGHFAWTGKNPLTTYLGANSASHYRFATRVLKRWQRSALGSR